MTLVLLTPTGGRPESLALLAHYINAQDYVGPLHWLICDDCDPVSPVPVVCAGISVEVIRPDWRWQPGQNTQARSMLALLERVPAGAGVVMMEDDDCYLPTHLQVMQRALQQVELAGQRISYYYNVNTRRHRQLPGVMHASLGASAFRGEALTLLKHVCTKQRDRLDMSLWRAFPGPKALLNSRTAIGIKGMPGRGGIGIGHRENFGELDPHGEVLRDWVGDYAAEYRWHRRSRCG